MLTGCVMDTSTTYTFWIGTFSVPADYSLQDGYYRTQELTKASFDWQLSNNFYNKPQYVWTEDQLFSYLIGLGFGNLPAEEEAAWLVSVNHGYIELRKGSTLYFILK